MQKIAIFITTVIFLSLVVFAVLSFSRQKHEEQIVSKRQIQFGAWTEGFINPETKQIYPDKLLAFEQLIQKKVSIAHYYIGWEALSDPEFIGQLDLLQSHNWEPMVNVNPYYFSDCPPHETPLYRAIAEGVCDDFIREAGQNLSKVKKPFYLIFAWEMNNDVNSWSVPYTGSTSQDFVDAWRHIHTIFKQENVSNVIWVFCPNIPDVTEYSYSSLYPGDEYVDWVGLDGYNWGTTQSWSEWLRFSDVFKGPYENITTIAPDKPLVIAEVNTTDKGGDKANWYTDMFEYQIPYNFPKIQAVVIFNEDRTRQEQVNWKVDITPQSLEAFTSAVNSEYYK